MSSGKIEAEKIQARVESENQRRSTKAIRCWDPPSDRIANLACKCRSSAQERWQGQSLCGLPGSQ